MQGKTAMKRFTTLVFLGLALILPAVAPAGPAEYQGVVNHIYDSATIRIAYRGGQIHVRLAGVQPPYNDDALQTLSRLLLGKTVRVEAIRWEKGYLIGRVFADGRPICEGLADARGKSREETSGREASSTHASEEA
jgi:endonuclease YncB( thermonuclease family)